MNLFGKKKAPPPPVAAPTQTAKPNTKDAITKLKDTMETIEKREQHIQRKITKENEDAVAFSKANKKREALQCIKRKKMYEKQLEQMSNVKMNMEQQQLALENVNIQREILEAQSEAANTMSAVTKQMGGVDKVDEVMDAVEDQMQDAEEINEALGRQIAMPGLDADDEDLLAELEGLEQESLADELGNVQLDSGQGEAALDASAFASAPVSFPSAGTSAPKKAMTEDERELAELEASMAM